MGGTVKGGRKAAATNKTKDPDFYKKIGRKGGKISSGGGFALNPELARAAGRIGGVASRRTKTT